MTNRRKAGRNKAGHVPAGEVGMAATRRGLLGAVAGVGALSLSGAARAQGTATGAGGATGGGVAPTGGGTAASGAAAGADKAGRVIRIGVLNDMSGVYRDISGPISIACVHQAIAEFDPGAHGLAVEVLTGDHQNKPDVGANLVRQWIDRDRVDMVIDVPNSAVALAVAGVCREKDRVFINSGAGTADLTGSQCAATTVHWTYDTWQLAHSTGGALVAQGGKSWFFITADYAFGQALERDTTAFVKGAGGTVLGSVRAPLSTSDFSSYLLQAQSSGAQVVGLCNAGTDMSNAVKQAAEFGLTQNGTKLAALLCFISDVQALGLPAAKGLVLTSTFYWNLNDRTRAFSAAAAAADRHPRARAWGRRAATPACCTTSRRWRRWERRRGVRPRWRA